MQVVTILGDPTRPGPYSQLLGVGPQATIPAHHHAGDRIGTVLSGTWMFGYGPQFDRTTLKVLPAGSVYTEPSEGPHFAMTGDDAVTVLITGNGPTDTVYEDPADDPAAGHTSSLRHSRVSRRGVVEAPSGVARRCAGDGRGHPYPVRFRFEWASHGFHSRSPSYR